MEKSDESRTRRHEQRRQYSKMDKGAKNKLVGSSREDGGGRPRKTWKEEAERDLQVLGVKRWRKLVAERKK